MASCKEHRNNVCQAPNAPSSCEYSQMWLSGETEKSTFIKAAGKSQHEDQHQHFPFAAAVSHYAPLMELNVSCLISA